MPSDLLTRLSCAWFFCCKSLTQVQHSGPAIGLGRPGLLNEAASQILDDKNITLNLNYKRLMECEPYLGGSISVNFVL